jgi:hypothetical protein
MTDPTPPVSATTAVTTTGPKSKKTRSPRLRAGEVEARQDIVLLKTICGQKALEIAKEMQMSVRTVRTDLQEARRSEMLLAARDRVQTLIPKAIAVLEAYLEDGDKDVALVVLEGLGVIGKHIQVNVTPTPPTGGFNEFRQRIIDQQSAAAGAAPDLASDRVAVEVGPVIDAEVEAAAGPPAHARVLSAHRFFRTHIPEERIDA